MSRREVTLRTSIAAAYVFAAFGIPGWMLEIWSISSATLSTNTHIIILLASVGAPVLWAIASGIALLCDRKRGFWALPAGVWAISPMTFAGVMFIGLLLIVGHW